MQTVDPFANTVPLKAPRMTLLQAEARAEAAQFAARKWRETPWTERQRCLRGAAKLLRERAPQLALLMAREMGKPITQGQAECEKSAWACNYYAEQGRAFLQPEYIQTDGAQCYVAFEPLGVLLAVMPWNFPIWQVVRCAAPAMAAGNAVLLKHASNVPGCAREVAQLFHDAGFPSDVFSTVFIDSDTALALVEHPAISAVSLTGSVAAGRAVAIAAAKVLKKCVLELGGSDPYLVLADADPIAAASICVESRLINCGQSCVAAKRFIVVRSIAQAFTDEVVRLMSQYTPGDPTSEATQLGPMARIDLRDALHQQVHDSVARGALLLLGGHVPTTPGAWYPPTVLAHVRPQMPAYHEELFGPVAAILEAVDEEDAIRIANDTAFGLGSAVFTADRNHGERIAQKQLEAGSCFVNALVRSDPRLPFGGIKHSGYGRELGAFGIREFVNVKTVYVK